MFFSNLFCLLQTNTYSKPILTFLLYYSGYDKPLTNHPKKGSKKYDLKNGIGESDTTTELPSHFLFRNKPRSCLTQNRGSEQTKIDVHLHADFSVAL